MPHVHANETSPPERLDMLGGLRELVSATTTADCVIRIEFQAQRLFGGLGPLLSVTDADTQAYDGFVTAGGRSPLTHGLPLRARGRILGRIAFRHPELLASYDSEELEAFAEHAALALDNARLLEDHGRRARLDPLTGLLNRGEFHELLATAVAKATANPLQPLSLALFDLDCLKSVNDEGGHVAGDRLLRATAAALTAVCRSTDAAFRIGGDEFALILPGASAADAEAIAARAGDAIARLEGSAGASWGVATMPVDAATREDLVAVADASLYERKGRTSAVTSVLRRDVRGRLEVATRLAVRLTDMRDPRAIAEVVVGELHSAFGYYLAVINRLDGDGVLRVLGAAGRLAEKDVNFLAWEQPLGVGVNGRVARTGEAALVNDTRLDPDYLTINANDDPGSQLCVPILVDGQVWGVLNLEQLATHGFDEYDMMLADAVVAQTGAAIHRCELIGEMEQSFSTTLGVLCDALETKDAYTADHAQQVAELAVTVAGRVGLPEHQRRGLRYCGLLHDIGKIGVRSELLTKPARLTDAEYLEIQEHSAVGAALLSRIPLLADVAPLVRAVHERWDGHGYPDGLAGRSIPIESRIVAVCDAWHAMRYDRPYRRALSHADAVLELSRNAGTQFDPDVVRAFISAVDA
jgi:diguanylate cyclase (GGDEF)-like protein